MSSNLEFLKKCIYCSTDYIAKTRVTKYCSHRCNQKHYKQVKRQEKSKLHTIISPLADERNNADDFLTITKSAILLGVTDRIIFRLIARKIITPVKRGRKVEIPKNQLFKTTVYDNIDS